MADPLLVYRFFRTPLTGPQVFAISLGLNVWRIGPYSGAVAQAAGMWPAEGILLLEVAQDVADWLSALPQTDV
jgi:hypothetical protein